MLLLGGALGDAFGRRKVFVIGTIWFAIASLACGLAPSAGFLIAARAVQGAGAALLVPGSLAIIQASFAKEDRARAIGAWSGLGGVATAIGPFLGGWLISAVSWRLVFFINLPAAAVVVAISVRHVPESRAPGPRQPLDAAGATTISLALAGITYGLIAASDGNWASPTVLGTLLPGAALLVGFCVIESRSKHAMLPLTIFRSRQFSGANAVTFVVYGALGGALFLIPVVLQEVCGYSALEAGVALLPITVIMLTLSARSAALAARIGPRLQMTTGPLVIAAGLLLLTRVHGNGDYLTQVLPAVLVFGFGLAINVAPLTSTALSAAPAEHSGIASAVNNDVARAASLIAVAVLPPLAGITGDIYQHPAALTSGFHKAVLIAAAVAAAGGVLAAATIRNPSPAPGRERSAEPGGEALGGLHCALDAPPLRPDAYSANPPVEPKRRAAVFGLRSDGSEVRSVPAPAGRWPASPVEQRRRRAGAIASGNLGVMTAEDTQATEAVRTAARAARAAAPSLAGAADGAIDAAIGAMARGLADAAPAVLAANEADMQAAADAGLAAGVRDRLRLDADRLKAMAAQLEILAGVESGPPSRKIRDLPGGLVLTERSRPVGVIGANFEARPNVVVDIASQLVKSRNAGVLRTGSAALRSAIALADEVITPALAAAGLDPAAIELIRVPGQAAAYALVREPKLIPLVILRGSGDSTRALAAEGAAHGVRTLAHADGGGVLYIHPSAERAAAARLISSSLDRLGVCNRLNLLLLDRRLWDSWLPEITGQLSGLGIRVSLPPHDHPLGYEWALDPEREATVTIAPAGGPVEAAMIANDETSGLAAGIAAADEGAAAEFLAAYTGTGAFWNATTRLLDGFKLLELPETGINIDAVPGPRGPVTFRDLCLRQFVVTPA